MKLISATIENYRIHKFHRIDFDAHRTLIGGPNESGKSTMIEAIHRALFFRHSAGGEVQSSMVSSTHGGIPSVELVFEAAGTRYHLKKEFGGTSKGRATLTPDGKEGVTGDGAESELARILATDGPITGRGAQSQLDAQWAHLWIWQGNSGSNPSQGLGDVGGDLIDRLQETGGAVALQSTLDATIASEIASNHNSLFSGRGPRANSPEGLAAAEVEEAREAVGAARERVETTRQDAARVIQSDGAISRYTESLTRLREQLSELEQKLKNADLLQTELKDRHQAFELADTRWTDLDKADKRIAGINQKAESLTKRLKPEQERLEATRKSLDEVVANKQEAQKGLDLANKAVDSARFLKEYADLLVSRFRYERDYDRRGATLKSIKETQAAIVDLNKRLARLPDIKGADVAALRKLEQAVVKAKSTLEAISTDIEITESTSRISLNGVVLERGRRQAIDEPAELTIGEDTRLRITPGGGKRLEQARRDLGETENTLRAKLQSFGLDSAEAVAIAQAEVNSLKATVQAEEKRLEALNPEETTGEHERLGRELESVIGRLENLAKQVKGLSLPEALEGAEKLAVESDEALRGAIVQLEEKRAGLRAFDKRVEGLEGELNQQRKQHQKNTAQLADLQTELRVLCETYGSDKTRQSDLEKAKASRKVAEEQVMEIRDKLEALDPKQLGADQERLERAVTQSGEALQQTRTDRAEAKGRLESDGRDDPQEVLTLAEARLMAATERHAREARLGEAITLLKTAFAEEQATLSEQFSRPLADRITVYLQALFGKSAQARVSFQDNQLNGIELIRDTSTGTFAFDSLSGGTREQMAAAVRLAVAELLATKHGGTLPVVFDDAFAYSDPDRVQKLQRMLDHAANNGLQVIILSCTPTDYAGLGAKVVAVGTA